MNDVKMKMVDEAFSLGNYSFQSVTLVGPDYDDFTTNQRAYFTVENEIFFFDNCYGIQVGNSSGLLDEANEVILSICEEYIPSALYELDSTVWQDLINEQRAGTPYLMQEDIIQKNLKHYFFQANRNEYWHILSNKISIINSTETTHLRNEFCAVKENVFNS